MDNSTIRDKIRDKIKGMIAFLAIGDALGVPMEFKYQKDVKYTGILEHIPFLFNRFTGKRYLVIGQYSDDTELSITLARNLIKNKGKYNRDSVILDYLEWDNSGTPMRGRNTRSLFDKIKTVKGYEARYQKIFHDDNAINSVQSNGSLMRCSPLVILDSFLPVIEDCKITNPSIVNQDASQIQILALRCCLLGMKKQDILDLLKTRAQTKGIEDVMKQILSGDKSRDLSISKGWVAHSLYASLAGLFFFDDPRKAIDWIIGNHPGSDTDTNGSIAGQLLGCYYGFNHLMKDPIIKDNWNLILKMDPNKGEVPRPDKYLLKDFDSICDSLTEIYFNERKKTDNSSS